MDNKLENLDIFNNVLLVGPGYKDYRGGIGGVLATYMKYFPKRNFISTYNYKSRVRLFLFYFVNLFKLIVKLIRNKDLKIIHIHTSIKGSFYRKYIILKFAQFLFNKKTIYHIHSGQFINFYINANKLTKYLIKDAVESSTVIVGLSEILSQQYLQYFKINKIVSISNPVETNSVLKFKKHYLSEGPIKLLFLGKICYEKGIFNLINTISRHKNIFDGKLTLDIGGNHDVEKLMEFIKLNNLHDIVKYHGWVSGELKNTLLSNADIFILPSHTEAFPLSILEAMSFGLPIITTNVGGIPDIVKNNVNGFISNPRDEQALFQSIKNFIDNRYLLETMSNSSLQMVEKYYPNTIFNTLNDLYINLLE